MSSTTVGELIQNNGSYLQELKSAVKQEIRCAMPGIIHDYDAGKQTATIQPAIRDRRIGMGYENLPLLLDVPVYFPGNASVSISYPVRPGDECLVIFADSCIDAWYQSGGTQNPVVPRRHDLSDGFALVGFRSSENVFPTGSGHAFVVKVKTPGGWSEPFAITQNGDVLINGSGLTPSVYVENSTLIIG